MSIFSRYKEIVEANISSMLAKSDNPERMLRLMIQDMEDTLVEMKASCAGIMAEKARALRTCERVGREIERWTERATLALSKGREDMAREALLRKQEVRKDVANLEAEIKALGEKIARSQDEIAQVEVRLRDARDKLRSLIEERLSPKVSPKPAPEPPKPAPPVESPAPAVAAANDEIEKELSLLKSKLNENNSQR
jgi:phage shock protein A